MNKKRIILIAVAAVIIVGGGVWLFGGAKAKHKVTYATATIHKGEISESVTATGTIEPVTEVEVGTQVSGIIDKIHVDYNSVVTKGTVPVRSANWGEWITAMRFWTPIPWRRREASRFSRTRHWWNTATCA